MEDPQRLASDPPGVPPAFNLEVRKLREVAGFITKVRHNPVRFRLPLTMRALAAVGIEIDFFAAYAPEFTLRRSEGLTDEQRLDLFVTALQRWLRPSDDTHRVVADVLAHEVTLIEVADEPPAPPPAVTAVVGRRSRPRRRAVVRVLDLTVHPPDVAELPPTGCGAADLDRRRRCYAYIPTPAGPRVKSLAPELAPLMHLADGSATIEQIASNLDLAAAVDDVAVVFEQLVHAGLADIEEPCA